MSTFAQQWLDIQVRAVADTTQALLLVVDGDKLVPAARWPQDDASALGLTAVAKMAVDRNAAVTLPEGTGSPQQSEVADLYAMPVRSDGRLFGVVALKCRHRSSDGQQQVIHALSVGANWLALPESKSEQVARHYTHIVGSAANCVGQESAPKSIAALLGDLSSEYQCERVCFGVVKRGHIRVAALSNASSIDARNEFNRAIAAAMDEAASQAEIVCYPGTRGAATTVQRAHRELADQFGAKSILSIPLVFDDKVFGVITLEKDGESGFDQIQVAACSQLLAIVAPYLYLKNADERFWLEKNVDNWGGMLAAVFGYRYITAKLAVVAIAAVLGGAALYEGEFRVTARAMLEGKVQRVISAPMDGFLKSASVRAGDTVAAGVLMAEMDDQDLRLKQAALDSQLEQLQRERRETMANRQLVEMRLTSARIEQVAAELALNRELLERVRIRAPFDGVVIEGDLSQLLGAPVERGEMLFKVAPLQGYRVILEIDETDVAHISAGQSGTIILAALPDERIEMQVLSITAVARTADKANVFRVEAKLDDPPEKLRPGMEGVGKVSIGSRSLLWIWTHDLRDWLQLLFWRWLP